MRASGLAILAFSGIALAGGKKAKWNPPHENSPEKCLNVLKTQFEAKGVVDQPGLDTFGGACKGTRVIREKMPTRGSVREEWLMYACCKNKDDQYRNSRFLPLQNCLAFNDAGGGTLTWEKSMSYRLAESCPDCKVVDGSHNGNPGAHLRCTCAAPNQAPKTYELPVHADLWAEGDVRADRMSRYPCSMNSGMIDCGWARCVHKVYEPGNPPGHWHGPGSPEANDPK